MNIDYQTYLNVNQSITLICTDIYCVLTRSEVNYAILTRHYLAIQSECLGIS